jgi:hypothetical protein
MSLLQATKALLAEQQKAGKSIAEIHRALGRKIQRDWFYKFAAGDIPDPSVNRVQLLHDRLKSLSAETSN